MKERGSVRWMGSLRIASAALLLLSCASGPDILGKWREVGKTGTLEFYRDGTFKAVDSEGMAVSGRYLLDRDGNLRCEVEKEGHLKETVDLKVSILADDLTIGSSGSKIVERYRRER